MTKPWRHFDQVAGSIWISIVLGAVIMIWLVTGLLFHFSRTWLSLMTLGTSIVTLFVIFLILSTRKRHTKVLFLKLDRLERIIKRMHRGRHNGQT
jgi:low affinity Fe/Cu permease